MKHWKIRRRRKASHSQRARFQEMDMAGLRDPSRPKCLGKKRYGWGQAMQAARLIFDLDGGSEGAVCVYPCEHCGHGVYHVGHQRVLTHLMAMRIY